LGNLRRSPNSLVGWGGDRRLLRPYSRACGASILPYHIYVRGAASVDITEFVIKKLSAVFATKNLLELGGGVCDKLNFMNLKIHRFKIRKKIVNFRKF